MSGHTFVVHGRMESLVWDAAIIPTDSLFNIVRRNWDAVLRAAPDSLQPMRWGHTRRFGRAADGRAVWFLNVTAPSTQTPAEMLSDLRGVLTDIADSDLAPSSGRHLPLVALPVVGIGNGGFGGRTGEVVRGLLKVTEEVSAEHNLDIVIVATKASAFAALQAERRDRSVFPELDPDSLDRAKGLGEMASQGRLALLLGAGVSIPAGLPSWHALVEEMRVLAIQREPGLDDARFTRLGVLDQAELLQRVLGDDLATEVAKRIGDVKTPALAHVLLAGLDCHEVVTTNYDQCYEQACAAKGDDTYRVMPWDKPEPDRPWVLKIHGDVERPKSIVLTRGQIVGFDSLWRPAGALFQSVLLTKHLLVVGASLTDDNILRLAHEAKRFRKEHGVTGLLGTVLTLEDEPMRALLWQDELNWLGMGGDGSVAQARRLEVFLDAVAAHACRDVSYLLDPDFAYLIPDCERGMTDLARELAARVASLPTGSRGRWSRLAAAMAEMGAAAPR